MKRKPITQFLILLQIIILAVMPLGSIAAYGYVDGTGASDIYSCAADDANINASAADNSGLTELGFVRDIVSASELSSIPKAAAK